MESSNKNHEDKDNEGNINIPLATSALERKMLEYITAQTQFLQAMAQTMVKIHQSITEQVSLLEDHNTVTNDNHQNMTPPPFEKEKLSAMQTQALQVRMQPSTTYFRNEMAKERVHIGPVKRQVAEVWNKQRKKKRHGALKQTMEKQHEVNKAPDMCPCGEHHGLSCPRRKLVL
jgi:septal ring factor EnvC (AmiA/AmiB activator)